MISKTLLLLILLNLAARDVNAQFPIFYDPRDPAVANPSSITANYDPKTLQVSYSFDPSSQNPGTRVFSLDPALSSRKVYVSEDSKFNEQVVSQAGYDPKNQVVGKYPFFGSETWGSITNQETLRKLGVQSPYAVFQQSKQNSGNLLIVTETDPSTLQFPNKYLQQQFQQQQQQNPYYYGGNYANSNYGGNTYGLNSYASNGNYGGNTNYYGSSGNFNSDSYYGNAGGYYGNAGGYYGNAGGYYGNTGGYYGNTGSYYGGMPNYYPSNSYYGW